MPQMNVMEPVDLFPDLFWLKETVSYEGGKKGEGKGHEKDHAGVGQLITAMAVIHH